MPLSITKLEKLLSIKGFYPSKYFTIHSLCIYIEIISIDTADIFYLYIPSKYEIKIKKGSNVYKLKYIDTEQSHNRADEYAGKPDDFDVENNYEEIDFDSNTPKDKKTDIETRLEEKYKRYINLKDISNDDVKELKDIYRQIKRLSLCVQNIRYKIVIQFKNYMLTLSRNNEIETYWIKHYTGKDTRKLFISIDLEIFYEKLESLKDNAKTIKNEIYHILDKNRDKHIKTLVGLLNEKHNIIQTYLNLQKKRDKYDNYLQELEEMLENMIKTEQIKVKMVYDIENKHQDMGTKGLHSDIQKSHEIASINTEIEDITSIKQNIIKNIFDIKTKRDSMILYIDQIMFDNIVMLESIIKNFSKFDDL